MTSRAWADDRVGVCIPTLNPGRWIDRQISALAAQRLRPSQILVIDSSSDDGTIGRFRQIGARIVTIRRDEFDHGGTRNAGIQLLATEIVIFLTQDAIPADDDALANLVAALDEDGGRGVVFGRQLPTPGAGPLARAHRSFNYGPHRFERTGADVATLGVRAAFSSNSFAAYRADALNAIGGFPSPVIGSEDRAAAARLLQNGWTVAYAPAARVEHSHDYRLSQEFRRYFDIGVFHATERWFDAFVGRPHAEGVRLVRSQVQALREAGVAYARLVVVAHAAAAWTGFQTGRRHGWLPRTLNARLSMAPAYFTASRATGG